MTCCRIARLPSLSRLAVACRATDDAGTRMSLRRNILIFHQAALGDFVITWPIAVAMGRMYPQSRVIYVTAASKGKLAEKVLGVESADVDAGQWHRLHAEGAELP